MATINTATPYASQIDKDLAGADATEAAADLKVAVFSYTVAVAGADDYTLVKLPPGNVRVYPELSQIAVDQGVATADFHLGHRAYVDSTGATVAEDDNEWIDDADIGGGALAMGPWAGHTAATLETQAEYDAADGLEIFATVTTANQDIGDTVTGIVVFSMV